MHAERILLVWLIAGVFLVLGLVVSGAVSIEIEKFDPDDKDTDEKTEDE